jgi:hypothetical protein
MSGFYASSFVTIALLYDMGANFSTKESAPTVLLLENISRLIATSGSGTIDIASSPDAITYTNRSSVSYSTPVDFVQSMHHHIFVPTGQFRYWGVQITLGGLGSNASAIRRLWLCQPHTLARNPDEVRITPSLDVDNSGRAGYGWRPAFGGSTRPARGSLIWNALDLVEVEKLRAIFDLDYCVLLASANEPLFYGARALSLRITDQVVSRDFFDKDRYTLDVSFEAEPD